MPNNPESKGSKGWFIGRFNAAKPKQPDNKKSKKARSFFFSFRIKIKDAMSNM